MSYQLAMRLTVIEGALLRVLGTVEHRGFRVLSCRVHTEATGACYRVDLDVEGERDVALLCRQMARLYDVQEVSWQAHSATA